MHDIEGDETFTASLGDLPSSVTAGSPNSVTVTITDDDGGGDPPSPPPPGSSDASLSGLTTSVGEQAFDPATTSYTVDVPHDVSSVTPTPTASHTGAAVTVNGAAVASGAPSAAIALEPDAHGGHGPCARRSAPVRRAWLAPTSSPAVQSRATGR